MGSRAMTKQGKQDLPFPRHWLSYIALKIGLIAIAVLLALYLTGAF